MHSGHTVVYPTASLVNDALGSPSPALIEDQPRFIRDRHTGAIKPDDRTDLSGDPPFSVQQRTASLVQLRSQLRGDSGVNER
jgi:hypothetical protein